MTFPPLASLFAVGVNEPAESALLDDVVTAAELVPLTGLDVATLLNSDSVYWNGMMVALPVPKATVSAVCPAFAFGRTKIAVMKLPTPPSALTASLPVQL